MLVFLKADATWEDRKGLRQQLTRCTVSGEVVPLRDGRFGYALEHMRRGPTPEELDFLEGLPQVDHVELGQWPDPRPQTVRRT
ncbi:MAG: hypothetical protein ABIB97_05875 [Patescibacteria group bacterium]